MHILPNNKIQTEGNTNNNSIIYPIIKSSFHNLVANNKKKEKMYRNFPNIISVYNKDDVNFVDPLVLDKFNNRYIHSFKNLSKNISKNII